MREIQEELGLKLTPGSYKFLGKLSPLDGASSFTGIYEILCEETPSYNHDDYTGHEWLQPNELLKRLETGELAKSDLRVVLKKFYSDSLNPST